MDLYELDLPAVVYTPHREARWCKMTDATWWDLNESMKLRDKTIADMIDEAAAFAHALDLLRPLMQANPEMTVAEAMTELDTL